ncbi:MAG: UDP-N-acetylmuramoyl-L-alanyl-D-glutamate--2,6-diaminopimelate ligase [Deltaproteobacteria bacterium]|nr:UDP-N-acetylmuramoyl-L-alanyl-D-glutamate--2,6-diaminopimelate ligase [Deltaproteobacteria bacterium]
MKLSHLLNGIGFHELEGDEEVEIKGIAYDSRNVRPGYLFVAIKGHNQDGHRYLTEAVKNGAVALVAEYFSGSFERISRINVPDSRIALSKLALRFYDNPCKDLDIVGITGTNGKTSTSYLLESIFHEAGCRPAVIGTINCRFDGITRPSPVTTPESLDLMRFMREVSDKGATHVFIEVSSHALDQGRTSECAMRAAVFTNFSRDHLDYHGTMERYFEAKSLLFKGLQQGTKGKDSVAIINIDDPRGEELASFTRVKIVRYGMNSKAQFRAESVRATRKGLSAVLTTPEGRIDIKSSLIGEINIYNILAAAATAVSLGIDLESVAEGLEKMRVVPGRLEPVSNNRGLTIVVDYAHTPDALLKALTNLRPLVAGRLITVFGCGGDRDKGKRSEMGMVAGEKSDVVFITSDNPRSEDPKRIVDQIEEGVRGSGMMMKEWQGNSHGMEKGYFIEVDRREAIRKAILVAGTKDAILIAGKGHEDYQIVGNIRRHFDDKEEAAKAAA